MTTKVLIVTDGDFRFAASGNPGTPDFTHSTLVATLAAAGFDVTKANRGIDTSATPGFDSFRFDALPAGRSLLEFDAIWLIGDKGRNNPGGPGPSTVGALGPAQHNAIAAYMQAGGGMFAVGDHDSMGSDMCGYLPRIRVMRAWYGPADPASPFPQAQATALQNFTKLDAGRADTIHKKMSGDTPPSQYPAFPDNVTNYVWFDNQSDSFPQTITPTPANPAHPILRRDGRDITVYPDHMHEGNTFGELDATAYSYMTLSPFGDTTQLEFPAFDGHQEKPSVIAKGQGFKQASRFATPATNFPPGTSANPLISTEADAKTVNTLSTYDGRNAGVGRIVTGSTFHHYIDINLIGSTAIKKSAIAETYVGSDALQGQGLSDNAPALDDIKAVYVNITNWIARPQPTITLILERSSFSQAEAPPGTSLDGAILVTIDGLKPDQFPGGGVTSLGTPAGLAAWAPTVTVPAGVPIAIEPTHIDSDAPTLPPRLQRFTVTYRVRFTGDAFNFPNPVNNQPVKATLTTPAASSALTDLAWLQLVKSASPYMLDLADGNTTTYLSSDIKVFRVVEGDTFLGVPLLQGAARPQALDFIHALIASISSADFSALPTTEEGSTLSVFPNIIGFPPKRVFNFALARVRLSPAGANAPQTRVFFRLFTTQTTAALTYQVDGTGMPVDGYRRTPAPNPIALPGTQNGGADWLSFPMFATGRKFPAETQTDDPNVQQVNAADGFRMYGALIDNNLVDPYLPPAPGSPSAPVSLPTLMMGEHQCIVAQIEFDGTPIPSGATPWTSDKLSQRNLAVSLVANPGLDDSRLAFHTFEIESTPYPTTASQRPDELLLHWSKNTPTGTVARIYLSTWKAQDVVDLATQFYSRHDLEALDAHTIELPAGGTRYVPIPLSAVRQNGILAVEFPLGIRKGERFDVSVRQITNKWRRAKVPPPIVDRIAAADIPTLLERHGQPSAAKPKGAIPLGANKVLITDPSIFDDSGDHALVIQHPAPDVIQAARENSGQWRETIGGFQLGVPVSTKAHMFAHHLQLLSIMRWRTSQLDRKSRWRCTMLRYVEMLVAKVQALGGNPWTVPPTPDGILPPGSGHFGGSGSGGGDDGGTIGGSSSGDSAGTPLGNWPALRGPLGCALSLLIMLVLILLAWILLHH